MESREPAGFLFWRQLCKGWRTIAIKTDLKRRSRRF